MQRYLETPIREDLKEKMVFVGGPRQVGKTTLSFHLLGSKKEKHPAYLNWDSSGIQKNLVSGEIPANEPLIVLDEIHKFKKWRSLVKGLYDVNKSEVNFLVTGSARLDFFRRGGDSLQGRYHYYRLHPLSLHELNTNAAVNDIEQLLRFGGFPEPFLRSEARHWKRWQNERTERVVQEDLVSLEHVKDVSQLKLLANLLPARVGSLLSIANLKSDLGVAYETVDKWIYIFENLYHCFRVQAHGFSMARAANKEKKLYMWDWSLVENPAARFENLVASHLLKYCHFQNDYNGEKFDLCFYRDSNKRELDFVVTKNRKPIFAVECKTGESGLAENIRYFSQRLPVPRYFQVHLGSKHSLVKEHNAEIIPFSAFSKFLGV